MNGLHIAIKRHGLTGLARLLGLDKRVVYMWRARGIVPPEHCPEIEKLMHGEVKCEDLNDRVDWAFLRSSTPASKSAQRASVCPE